MLNELNELIEAGSRFNDAESIRLRKLLKKIRMQLYRDTFLRQDYEALIEQHHKVAVEYNKLAEQLKIHADGAGMNYLAERCRKLEQEVFDKHSQLELAKDTIRTMTKVLRESASPAFRAYMSHRPATPPPTPPRKPWYTI
jgi:predicted phage tail protein